MPANKTVALISGANSGIELAVATQLARDPGFHVIVGSRNADAGEKVATSLVADGHSASSVQLDISSDKSITAASGWIEREFRVCNSNVKLLDQIWAISAKSSFLSEPNVIGHRSLDHFRAG